MLEYNRIDISEGIDIKKTNTSKECKIFHYWHFKDIGLVDIVMVVVFNAKSC